MKWLGLLAFVGCLLVATRATTLHSTEDASLLGIILKSKQGQAAKKTHDVIAPQSKVSKRRFSGAAATTTLPANGTPDANTQQQQASADTASPHTQVQSKTPTNEPTQRLKVNSVAPLSSNSKSPDPSPAQGTAILEQPQQNNNSKAEQTQQNANAKMEKNFQSKANTLPSTVPASTAETQPANAPTQVHQQATKLVGKPIGVNQASSSTNTQKLALQQLQVPERVRASTAVPAPANEFEVDFVFSWYNSKDQEVQVQRQRRLQEWTQASQAQPKPMLGAGAAKRFSDLGELRFALRGVDQFAPWVRNVFLIVGDNQPLPAWLDSSEPSLKIVRHSEIFPDQTDLPTYNSFAIEACLHRIPDLAEHFVYFNDDMLLTAPVRRDVFFQTSGKPSELGRPNVWVHMERANFKLAQASADSYSTGIFKGPPLPTDDSYVSAIKNANNLAMAKVSTEEHVDTNFAFHSFVHQGKAMTKSLLQQAEAENPEAFARTRHSVFRAQSDVWAIQLATMMCLKRNTCHQAPHPRELYMSFEHTTPAAMVRSILTKKAEMVCVNDGVDSPAVAQRFNSEFKRIFPKPSRFEKKS